MEKSKNNISETLFESSVNSLKEALIAVDFTKNVILANKSSTEIFDYSYNELIGLEASLLIESDRFQDWLEELSQYPETKDTSKLHLSDLKITIYTKYGYRNPATINCKPLVDADDVVKGGILSIKDTTEEKQFEKIILENNEKFKKITAFARDAILMIDSEGLICFWNNAATHIFGYKEEEVYGRDLHTLLAPSKYISSFKDGFSKFIKSGHGAAINNTLELTALRKSGEEFHIDLSLSAIKINSKWNAIGIIKDITERKNAEQKIIESETYYRTLIETSPDAIVTTDIEGNITYVSKRVSEILNIKNEKEIINTSILDWIDPDQHIKAMERISGIFDGSYVPAINEYILVRKDKSRVISEVSSAPVFNSEDNISGLLLIIHDITLRKKKEEELILAKEKAEESDRLKAAFIQNISHEIRTPMNALVGFSELLKEPDMNEEDRNIFVENIIAGTNQLLSIISNIVEISNIKANLVKFDKKELDPDIILNDIFTRFSSRADEKKLNLNIENQLGNNKIRVIADEGLLTNSLNHLVGNAIKFTHKGMVNISCNASANHITFKVKDSGIGISDELHTKIFEAFFQVENSTSRRYEGTGLGLTIAKAYIEVMGGNLSFSSVPGSGSEFSITLSCNCSECDQITKADDTFPVAKKTILVAEDDDNNFNLIYAYLKDRNVSILRAEDGCKAVKICESNQKIDLILMDLSMPLMDGYEATKIIRKSRKMIPIIAQTAYADEKEKVEECGCTSFLSKPYTRNQLVSALSKYLK